MIPENTILFKAMETLLDRLPAGWSADITDMERPEDRIRIDGIVLIRAPDGREGAMIVEVRKRLDPRQAMMLATGVKRAAGGCQALAVAPWISGATRAILRGDGINLLDLTGNVRIILSEPGLFIDTTGAEHDPSPDVFPVTLKGTKAAHIVRALCVCRPPVGVRALAAEAGTTPGYVSKLLGMLDGQAAVCRTATGQVSGVDLRRLLVRWAEDAPLEKRSKISTWIAPRGLSWLQQKLREAPARYAITGSFAATRRAPITAPRIISLYVDDPAGFARTMELRPAEAGANVMLLAPEDAYPFAGCWRDQDLWFAALPQVVADLLCGPNRGPAEAEVLLAWMSEHLEVWRG